MTSTAPVATTPPGLYPKTPYGDYATWDAINHSRLRHFRRTPLHARQAILHERPPTQALDFGAAVHVSILEPELFDVEFIVAPKIDRRFKEGKAAWAEFESHARGRTHLKLDEWTAALAMGEAVRKHPVASELIGAAGATELSCLWIDEETKLRCKSRLDRFTTYYGYSTVVDLKTAEDASKQAFEKQIFNFGYAEQAAFYLDGLNALAPAERRYVFLVVEKEPPYAVATYELEFDAIEEGRRACRSHLRKYRHCLDTNEWAGYPVGLIPISMPAWAFKHGDLS